MSYTLDHTIAECLSDKQNSKTAQRDSYLRDYDFYKSCWDSMNKWIESRLRKNKVKYMYQNILPITHKHLNRAPLSEILPHLIGISEKLMEKSSAGPFF